MATAGHAGRHRAGPARELRRGKIFTDASSSAGSLAEHRTHGSGGHQQGDLPVLRRRSSTRWRRSWASSESRSTRRMLGLGQKTGVDLPQEVSGVMPSEEWKIRNFKQKWYAGETISVGIGQGAVATTPIQLARAIGAITSDGVLRRPRITSSAGASAQYQCGGIDPDEETKFRSTRRTGRSSPTPWRTWCHPVGTAAASHLQGIDFAGKTGSAQTISNALKAKMGAAGKEVQGQRLVRRSRAAAESGDRGGARCSKTASTDTWRRASRAGDQGLR